MSTESEGHKPAEGDANPRRLFLREPGWRVAQKIGSEQTYCYMMAPGQDYYHRLLDGEIYFYHGTERLCAACAGTPGAALARGQAPPRTARNHRPRRGGTRLGVRSERPRRRRQAFLI